MERVGRIAPRTAQIAAGQTHKNAGQARARAFSLNRFEYFRDEHELGSCDFGRAVREGARLFPRRGIPDPLLPSGIRSSFSLARQPVQRSKNQRHHNNQSHSSIDRLPEQRGSKRHVYNRNGSSDADVQPGSRHLRGGAASDAL